MEHYLTIDVEAWHRGVGSSASAAHDGQLCGALEAVMAAMEKVGAHATFFVLVADAESVRSALRAAVRAGHEIACHGRDHIRMSAIPRGDLRATLRDARQCIEDSAGVPCRGFRAPYFSIAPDMSQVFDAIAAAGFGYDASLRLPLGTPIECFRERYGLREVPVPVVPCALGAIGVLGGLALRILPFGQIRRMVAKCERQGQPACLYLHPYEWYPHPRFAKAPWTMSSLRRGLLTGRTLPRLDRLARHYRLKSINPGV